MKMMYRSKFLAIKRDIGVKLSNHQKQIYKLSNLMRIFITIIILLTCQNVVKKEKHVLVIGIDGVLVDALLVAKTPNIDSLVAHGAYSWNAYCGGELGTATEQKTSSGPGWSSILTGVWVDKHQVPNNDFEHPNYDQYPHFFERIKEKKPKAFLSSIVNWKPINEQIVRGADYLDVGTDSQVAQKASQHLLLADPDVLFLQFDEVDGAGHKFGYSDSISKYLGAISKVDSEIGMVIKALHKRKNNKNEDWLIIVTTDHGGKNTGHGGQEPEVRRVFFIVCGISIKKGEINPGPGHVAVAPTVLTHLGIPIEKSWGWEGAPFGF
jgi:arylsulfatase A-like enzyme